MELRHSENSPVTKKFFTGRQKHATLILSAFLLLLALLFVVLLRSALNTAAVYRGVRIDGKNVGGYTAGELSSYLEEHYAKTFDGLSLTISSDSFERTVAVSELGIKVDTGVMAKKAFAVGRQGGVLSRFSEIIRLWRKPVSVDLALDFDTEAFNGFLDEICKSVYREVVPPDIVILEDRAVLRTGMAGQEADRQRLKEDIIQAVLSRKPAKITVSTLKKRPPDVDVESVLKAIDRQPVNAQFVKTSRTTYEIKPHQMGRKIDPDKLKEIVNSVENREGSEYEEISLPVEAIAPELTEDTLKEQLFKDTLASYTTHFQTNNENNRNRSVNIALAAKSIDGTLLAPGEEFSFNKIVGPRTPEKGYKIAHIFVDGQVQDGTGGGICQVSTTLYNAVLRSNLEVSERHNHLFIVGYVPLGMDAAVSYGYADLVFSNTTGHPLLINASVSEDNNLKITIRSSNDYPNLKVKLASETIRTTPCTVQYTDDPALPQGTEVVSENGSAGYVVDTYMKIYNGDILIHEEKLHRSTYQMLPKKILRGTAPVSEAVE